MGTSLSNCAVLGAGIGGLTLALCLHRMGVKVSVYERSAVISEVGAGLLLSPNAVSILYALGLERGLNPISIETPRWQVLDVSGRVLTQIQPTAQNIPAISLRRADLQKLLLISLGDASIHLKNRGQKIGDRHLFDPRRGTTSAAHRYCRSSEAVSPGTDTEKFPGSTAEQKLIPKGGSRK